MKCLRASGSVMSLSAIGTLGVDNGTLRMMQFGFFSFLLQLSMVFYLFLFEQFRISYMLASTLELLKQCHIQRQHW